MGSQLLIIYPPPFDPQRNEDEIAAEQHLQIHCDSVWVEVTEDHFKDGRCPNLEFEDPALDFYGLTAIQYQGEIIQWLQREYGDQVQVQYTLYEDYLVAANQGRQSYPEYRAHLSDLLLQNWVTKNILRMKTHGISLKIQNFHTFAPLEFVGQFSIFPYCNSSVGTSPQRKYPET